MSIREKAEQHHALSTVPPVLATDHAATPAPLEWQQHLPDPPASLPERSLDPMPSPAEAYANTGQANTEPNRKTHQPTPKTMSD